VALKLVTGNPGHRPVNMAAPEPEGRPLPPMKLTGRPAELWRRFIRPAWWLTSADGPKAWLWCEMQAEAEADVRGMTAARIGQLRCLGSELGFDPTSRARIGADKPPAADAVTRRYFKT
jgi:hypothetical protein